MTSKAFFKNLLYIGLFFLAIFLLVIFWLRIYTNHGQKLELPNFVNMPLTEASSLAQDESFEIIVNDSIHKIGSPGGIIIDQNPKPSSKVKENRKVYVTTTKYLADKITVKSLPSLYGREFERKSRELGFMDIKSNVKSFIQDPGEPNHILEVYYKGEKIISSEGRKEDVSIEKGGTLDFVLSKRDGGEMGIPDVVCMTYESASFLIENLKFKLGEVTNEGNITDRGTAYVIKQDPPYQLEGYIGIGDEIKLTISQEKPSNCN